MNRRKRIMDARAEIIEQVLARAGLEVRHRVEHNGAFLVVQVWCNSKQERAVRKLSLQIAGLAARQNSRTYGKEVGLVMISTKTGE